jgi:hypothetical protein
VSADINIAYTAPPTLGRFLGSDAFVRLVIGPVGSGKSSACAVELLRRATEQRPGPDGVRRSRFAVIRNTYAELRDTTRKTIEQWIPPTLGDWHETDNRFELACNDARAEILLRALDRPDDIRKLLSLELTGAWINEAREVPRGVFEMLQTRVGRYPSKVDGGASWFGIWMDTNPPDTDHWMFRLFEEQRPGEFMLYRQPDALSPEAENIENLPAGYYERLRAGKDEDWINVYVRGRYGFVKEGRPVYPEYRDELHCQDVVPLPTAPILLGQDWGLTPACVLAQRDPRDGQLQVFREFVSEDLGAVAFCGEVARWLRREWPARPVRGWGDPAGVAKSQVDERTPFDVALAAGLPLSPAPTNDFMRRREAVAGMLSRLTVLGRPALVIDPACRTLRKGMAGGYCYRRLQLSGGEERYRDVPDKGPLSHVTESLQYLACGEGEDYRALDGGRSRKVNLQFRVHRAMGMGTRRSA